MSEETMLVLFVIGAAMLTAVILVVMGELSNNTLMTLAEKVGEDGIKSYWNHRLMTEGVRQCQDCKEPFHPGDNDNATFCPTCGPKWGISVEAQGQTPRELRTYGEHMVQGKGMRPVYMDYPDLYGREEE